CRRWRRSRPRRRRSWSGRAPATGKAAPKVRRPRSTTEWAIAFASLLRSLETGDAFAEQAAWPEQQDEQHQQIDRGGRCRGIAGADHAALADAHQQRGGNDTQK